MQKILYNKFFPLFFLFLIFFFGFVGFTVNAFNITTVGFDESLSPLFGDGNLVRSPDDRSVRLLLDRFTGSGFISSNMYQHGFFSAMVKLPADYAAGVVVAFYMSNGDVFEKTHDELDIEFLGNIKGKPWRFQTNLYGNGSTFRGREERYRLWFDPSKEFHRYSILWTPRKVIFWVDDVPIREVIRSEPMGGEYPQKPMSLYATIWDASDWATSGGKFKANYKFAPFVAEFKSFSLDGCIVDPLQEFPDPDPDCSEFSLLLDSRDFSTITPKQRIAMRRFRQHYMYYSYCYDSIRYSEPPPECVIVPAERERFTNIGRLKFGGKDDSSAVENGRVRRRGRRRSRTPIITSDPDEKRL